MANKPQQNSNRLQSPPASNEPPLEPVCPDLSSFTPPVRLFIDTCIYESAGFAFDGPLLESVSKGVDASDFSLVIPSVIKDEVHSRLRKLLAEAKLAVEGKVSKHSVLHRSSANSLVSFLAAFWPRSEKESAARWEEFLTQCEATELPIACEHAESVFADYFHGVPPFGAGMKKWEFPDAFAIAALREHAIENGTRIVVVSKDSDVRAACEVDDHLVYCSELDWVLSKAPRLAAFKDKIGLLLEENRAEVEKSMLKVFVGLVFWWDHDEAFDADIIEVYDASIEFMSISIVDIDQNWVTVSGSVEIAFMATATYPDPDMTYTDDETKERKSLGSVTATLRATENLSFTLRVDHEKLATGVVDCSDIHFDNDWDIHIVNAEVESEVRENDV
ncbi:MAG: DUF4935 domain-containing protein [Tepidisphaera sp.]